MSYADFSCKKFTVNEMKNAKEGLLICKKTVGDHPLHWHDCFEIELILSGSASEKLNGTEYSIGKGDIYLLGPADFHEIKTNEPLTVINVMFTEKLIADEFRERILDFKSNAIFHLDGNTFESARFLLCEALYEFEHVRDYSDDYIKSLFECLFIIIMREYGKNEKNAVCGDIRDTSIHKAILYIHGHFRDNPCMEETAHAVGLNPSYFSSLFHKITGKTYKQYLSEIKLEYSKKLLLSSGLGVTDICFACGFNSLSNYLREFKKNTGNTPAGFRKEKMRQKSQTSE